MHNKTFGEVAFNTGWQTSPKLTISLWGKSFFIDVTASSYSAEQPITEAQETAFAELKKNLKAKQTTMEKLLIEFYKNYEYYEDGDLVSYNGELEKGALLAEVMPTQLLVSKDGECAVMFDQETDPDNGLAVVIYPTEAIMTQDEYL
jgi:hypothetical protein